MIFSKEKGSVFLQIGRFYVGVLNHRYCPMLFSERNGFRKYRHVGNFCFRIGRVK